ncbi:MAG: malto-oligosyltrehalose synthase [Aggregatilineales bacterium]
MSQQKQEALLERITQRPRIPRATYRLQFGPQLNFRGALALVEYLDALGISDIYTSPVFKPRSSSTHGYDVVDYNAFNPKLGGEEDFNALSEALRQRGMGLLLDIVPNHMGVNTENAWWMDVLKHGPASVYARYFDIDWRPLNRAMDDKVLLPVLGDHDGRVLEAGELKLVYWHGDFYVHYYEEHFPVVPDTYADILRRAHAKLSELTPEEWEELELLSVITAIDHLPRYTTRTPERLAERRREQTVIRWRLLGLFDKSERFRTAIERALEEINGTPGDPASFDLLDDILSRQPYRLSYWRVAADEINYRRFFDINDMAAIRIEDPQVFADTHGLTLRLLAEGKVSGLRIDHPDGLWNPEAYFMQIQEGYVLQRLAVEGATAITIERVRARLREILEPIDEPSLWPVYVLVEKILSITEPLPYTWAVYGTTGYEFLNLVNNLFVNSENEAAFDALYADFIGEVRPFSDLVDYTKHLVMSESLVSEIDARSAQLAAIVEGNRRYRGFTRKSLAFAMSEFIAALSIYRTYITDPDAVSDRDRHYINEASRLAKQRNPLTYSSVFDFLSAVLLGENFSDFTEAQQAALREFVMKFQQITGPVMAKSVEDTAFYIFNRLTSLNEVGGHPDHFGLSTAEFHVHNRARAFPYTMLSTSTHDTKRSEDVRARINVLSEMPAEWDAAIQEWAAINAAAKTDVGGLLAPSRNDEYLLYQTLVGAYPAHPDQLADFPARITGYMHKVINEAKTYSNWVNPNAAYARAVEEFIASLWHNPAFHAAFTPFQRRVAYFGWLNSLTQTLLKLTAPGVPDIYQGCELWDLSLVDPDNRRPVDFKRRQLLLADLSARAAKDRRALARELTRSLTAHAQTGAIKLYLTMTVLNYRRKAEALFRDGRYQPVETFGAKAGHAVAYLRVDEERAVLVVAPRLAYGLTSGRIQPPTGNSIWRNTALSLPDDLAGRALHNLLTGETIAPPAEAPGWSLRLAELLSSFPVGLFEIQ